MHADTFCRCHFNTWEGHEFFCPMAGNNQPGSVVKGRVFRNAYRGDIELTEDAIITLDDQGIHGTWIINGEVEQLTRINSRLSYSFDAPDTLCPIAAKANYIEKERG